MAQWELGGSNTLDGALGCYLLSRSISDLAVDPILLVLGSAIGASGHGSLKMMHS